MALGSSGTLYVGVAAKRVDYVADLIGIWRSSNPWAPTPTWTQVPNPPAISDGEFSPRYWYHFSLSVDPFDDTVLYMTEYDVWRHVDTFWQALSRNGFTTSQKLIMHPDNHVMAWVIGAFSEKRLLVGGDGGILISKNNVPGSWDELNNGLATMQIYKGAVDPRPDSFLAIAGMQDNASAVNTGTPEWNTISFGDGGDCAISSSNPDTQWAVSYDVQDGNPDLLRTLDGGKSLPTQAAFDLSFDLLPDTHTFYVHFEKSPRNDDLFIAGTARLWRCNNFFSSSSPDWTQNSPLMLDGNGLPVALS
ncbi:MAG TPA: hypothetical protein VGE41_07740, partial [Verrucomicrobiae bacterium]